MAVVFDTGFLVRLLDQHAQIATPTLWAKANQLVTTLSYNRETIIIPTPVLSEFLAGAGSAGPALFQIVSSSAVFRIEPFDTRAAIEAAALTAAVVAAGKAHVTSPQYGWQLVKVDLQIVAIARVNGAGAIFSDDTGMKRLVAASWPAVMSFNDLPNPPAQQPGTSSGWPSGGNTP